MKVLCAPGSRSVLITIKIETRYSTLLSECHTCLFINLSDILIIEHWCCVSKQLDIQSTGYIDEQTSWEVVVNSPSNTLI